MKIKRTVRSGHLRVYGRRYRIPNCALYQLPSDGTQVWIEEDCYIGPDNPDHCIYTAKHIKIFWPDAYTYLIDAALDEE